jgi:hypothetical protein
MAVAGLLACRSADPRPVSRFPYHDEITFRGFAEEVLVGHATPRTHRFDDYTEGSYHVSPREVATRLFQIAPSYGLQLEAVAVIGPHGPLWSFDVISILREQGCTRVNWLLMPHARITSKRSACLAPHTASAFMADLLALAPSAEAAPNDDSCVVVGQPGTLHWSRASCHEAVSSLTDQLDAAARRISPQLMVTYWGYPPTQE